MSLVGSGFDALIPQNHIGSFAVDGTGLLVSSIGKDPGFELKLTPETPGLDYGWLLIRFVFLSGGVSLLLYVLSPLLADMKIVPVLLAGALMLVFTMA